MPRSNGGNCNRSIRLTPPLQPIPTPNPIQINIQVQMTQDSRNESGHAVVCRSPQQSDPFDEQSLDVNSVDDAFEDMFMSFNDGFNSPFEVRHD
jgi:hypothetical protein